MTSTQAEISLPQPQLQFNEVYRSDG